MHQSLRQAELLRGGRHSGVAALAGVAQGNNDLPDIWSTGDPSTPSRGSVAVDDARVRRGLQAFVEQTGDQPRLAGSLLAGSFREPILQLRVESVRH